MLSQPNSHIRRSPQTRPSFAGLRRYNRREMSLDVVVQDSEGWEIPLESFDISPTGIFVRSDFLFDVGQIHTLIFQLEGRGMFRVNARVARVEAPDQDDTFASSEVQSGMGYEFVETEEETWEQLCAVSAGV